MVSIFDAVSALEKLITMDKVNFLVGDFRSEAVLAMQDHFVYVTHLSCTFV